MPDKKNQRNLAALVQEEENRNHTVRLSRIVFVDRKLQYILIIQIKSSLKVNWLLDVKLGIGLGKH